MRLRRLRINHIPGIYDGYELEFQDGLTVVEGPNEGGKSTLARALRALLWPDPLSHGFVSASATFEDAEGLVTVTREGPFVTWSRGVEEVAPPALPDRHLAHSFFISSEELVAIQSKQGKDVAVAISKQMAGGYDMPAVRALFPDPVKSRSARKAASAYQAADRMVRHEEGRQDKIAHEAEQLDALRAKVSQGRGAQREHGLVQIALRLGSKQVALAVQQAQLAQLPIELATLSGDALERLDQRLEEQEDKGRQKVKLERDLERVQREAAEYGLAHPVEARTLALLDDKASILRETQRKLEAAILKRAESAAAHSRARQAVGGREGVDLDLGDGSEWFELLRQRTEVESERQATQNLLGHLETRGEAPERQREELEEGIRNLRLWLRSGLRSISEIEFKKLNTGLIALSLLSAIILFVVGSPYWTAALGAGAGMLVCFLALSTRPQGVVGAGSDRRARAQEEYPRDLDPPSSWKEEPVQECLRGLTQGLADWITFEEFERERSSLRNRLQGLEEQALQQSEERQELAKRTGADADLPHAELMALARGLDRLAQVDLVLAAATGEGEQLQAQVDNQLADLGRALEIHGEVPPTEVFDVKPAIEQLKQRSEALARAREAGERIGRDLDRLEEDSQAIAGYIAEIYESAGMEVGDRAGLAHLVNEALPAYLEARAVCRSLENSVAEAQGELKGAPEPLVQMTPEELDEHAATLEARAEALGELQREVAEITERVKLTKFANSQRGLLAKRRDALEALATSHDESLDHVAGRFLMGRVSERHNRDYAPLVLQHARRMFGAFTHHAYDLDVEAGGDASVIARDVARGVSLTPDKLSTGTRAQIFLAVRLAFVEANHAEVLPIFMDEALDHSDTGRFAAIVSSLGEIAKDGRQIIYLTNDPTDAALMERALLADSFAAPNRIDLAEVRRLGFEGPASAADLELPVLDTAIEPGAYSPAEYGELIRVPRLNPMRDQFDPHLFYLLEDDLEVLHKLLAAGVRTIGQWRAVLRNDAALALEVQLSMSAPPTLEKRALLMDVFSEAWRVGREPKSPVDMNALYQSKCLSHKWLKPLSEIAAKLNGDGQKFIGALREKSHKRSKGLQKKTIDELEFALVKEGHMGGSDIQTILDRKEVVRLVLSSDAARGASAQSVTGLVRRWCDHAQRGVPTNG